MMYSVTAPAGAEYRMSLEELETAKTCDKRGRALSKISLSTRAQPGTTT